MHTKGAEVYAPGGEYEITEVLGYWMMPLEAEGEWLPVMGGLHEDSEHFDLELLHFHVDPRFLDGTQQARAQRALQHQAIFGPKNAWHPAYPR